MWPTSETCIWLRVESPICWILIFGLAGCAHGKDRHGGIRSVVGQLVCDGETRATIGTVDKRIAEATVLRTEELSFAISADSQIRRDQGALLGIILFREADLKGIERLKGNLMQLYLCYLGSCGGILGQLQYEVD